MAYTNPFSYNRDSSVDSKYKYVADLSKFKPIYGSSVSFSSRLNYLQTVDNSLKILPASENNLVVKYNLKFLLTDDDLGSLLKTIEIAGAYKYLKFTDPSNFYKDIIGLVEDYGVNKSSQNLNELNITVSSYFKSPIFNWRTSSFFNIDSSYNYSPNKNYSKYDFVYYDDMVSKNKIDNFWFANSDIIASNSSNTIPDANYWNKKFIFEPKLPFELKNKFDFYQSDYKNSFIQNIKHKENSNTLKQYSLKFENISDKQCLSMLLYLEKKCGYRRFIYDFPFLLKKAKVFICAEWNHIFKYSDCNDITATFTEDPNPDMSQFLIEGEYDGVEYVSNSYIGFINGLLYKNDILFGSLEEFSQYPVDKLFYSLGAPANGVYKLKNYLNGIPAAGIVTNVLSNNTVDGLFFIENGDALFQNSAGIQYFYSNEKDLIKYNGLYLNGSIYDTTITDDEGKTLILYGQRLFEIKNNSLSLYRGLFDKLFYSSGILKSTTSYDLIDINLGLKGSYAFGYPIFGDVLQPNNTEPYLYRERLYIRSSPANNSGFKILGNFVYFNSVRFSGIYENKYYFKGRLASGCPIEPENSALALYYKNGIALLNSDTGIPNNDGYFYKYGYKIISTGYYNSEYYLNGVKQTQ